MSIVRVTTNFNIDIELLAPPFYRRLFAWTIDIVVLIFYIIVGSRFLGWIFSQLDNTEDSNVTRWAISLVFYLPFILYHVVLEATMNGQSIGKRSWG